MPEQQPPKSWEKTIQEKLLREKKEQFGDFGLTMYDGQICGLTGYGLLKLLGKSGDGGIIGYPVQEWCRQNPLQDSDGWQLNLILAPNKIPPFTKNITVDGKRKTIGIAQITIPSPVVDLTYEKIRNALGGKNGLPWGNYIARAYVCYGHETKKRFGQSQIVVRGQSGAGAMRNLNRVLTLYDVGEGVNQGKVLDKRISYSDEDGTLNKRDMYPAWIWIHKPSLAEKPDKLQKIKIMIYDEKEPKSFKEQLNAIL